MRSGLLRWVLQRAPQFAGSLARCLPVAVRQEFVHRMIDAVVKAGLSANEERNYWRTKLAETLEEAERFQLPSLVPRRTPPVNTWIYQNERLLLPIQSGDRVLDIGSGAWPFTKATHLADMYVGETTHRLDALKRDGRPFVVLDVQQLPFRDKEWDFIFCSHLLEHVERPGDACRELMRTARRGYIEVPTRLSDVMLNFTRLKNHHRWHGLILGTTLVFIEWQDEERKDVGTNYFFQALHSRYENSFQQLFEENWPMFFGMLPWCESFDFLVIDKNGVVIDEMTRERASVRTRG